MLLALIAHDPLHGQHVGFHQKPHHADAHLNQRLAHAIMGVRQLLQPLANRRGFPTNDAAEQCFFRIEVPVYGHFGDPGFLGHGFHGDGIRAVAQKQAGGGIQHGIAFGQVLGAARAAFLASRRGGEALVMPFIHGLRKVKNNY